MTPAKSKPDPSVLPSHLAASSELIEASHALARSLDNARAASEARRKARLALDEAPKRDEEALRAAVAEGKPDPDPSEPLRKAELAAAQRRLDTANGLAREADAAFRRAVVNDREGLSTSQSPRVAETADAVNATLDTLAAQLEALSSEAGVFRGIYATTASRDQTQADERSRMMGREPAANPPSFGPASSDAPAQVKALRATVEDLRAQPTPAPDKAAERAQRLRKKRRARVAA